MVVRQGPLREDDLEAKKHLPRLQESGCFARGATDSQGSLSGQPGTGEEGRRWQYGGWRHSGRRWGRLEHL